MNNESKMKSLCNLITTNRKGDRHYSHRPEQLLNYPQRLKAQRDKTGATVLAISFQSLKT